MDFTGERFLPSLRGEIHYEHLHRYLLARQLAVGKRVLDVACGEGYGSALLSETALSVTGVDIDPQTVSHADLTYRSPNLTFKEGQCEALPLPDRSVDLVVSFETIEHHPYHEEMMQEIRRVLVAGGMLLISSPNKAVYSDLRNYTNPYHVKELYEDEFKTLLRRYFRYSRLYEQRLAAGSIVTPHIFTHDDAQEIIGLDEAGALSRNSTRPPYPYYFIALATDDEQLHASDPLGQSFYLDQIDLYGDKLAAIEKYEQRIAELARALPAEHVSSDPLKDAGLRLQRLEGEFASMRTLQGTVSRLAAELEDAQQEQRRTETRAQELENELAAKQHALAILRAEKQSLFSELAAARTGLTQAQAKLSELTEQAQLHRTQLEQRKAQLNALEQDIHELRISTSWRATAPLRWLSRALSARRHS